MEDNKKQTAENETVKSEEKPIPFFGDKLSRKEKSGYRFGLLSFLSTLALLLIVLTFTPAYSLIISMLPASVHSFMFSNLYQNITLQEETTKIDKPIKITPNNPLNVLSFDTGVCFSFYSSQHSENTDYIDAERLKGSVRGKKIAEIIAIGTQDKYKYHLEKMSMNETLDKDDKSLSIVCQKFGNGYGSIPKTISEVHIRPLEPFTAHQIIWSSTKHIYSN